MASKPPWFMADKDLPPELRLLYFVSVRYRHPSSKLGYKLRDELGIDKLEQDATLFPQVVGRLLDEGLVSLEGSAATASREITPPGFDSSVGSRAENLYPTAKGSKLVPYIPLGRWAKTSLAAVGILCLAGAGILLVEVYLGSLGSTKALLSLLALGGVSIGGPFKGVSTLAKRRRLIEHFESQSASAQG